MAFKLVQPDPVFVYVGELNNQVTSRALNLCLSAVNLILGAHGLTIVHAKDEPFLRLLPLASDILPGADAGPAWRLPKIKVPHNIRYCGER